MLTTTNIVVFSISGGITGRMDCVLFLWKKIQ